MPPEVDSATNYHQTIEMLRRDLMLASRVWQSQVDQFQADGTLMDDMSNDQKIAFAASSMAASYSYTLAAALGIAEKIAPEEFAQHLAFEVDEILTNGDFEDHNSDIRPDEDEDPENAEATS